MTFMLWKIIIEFQAVSNDTKFNGVNGYEDFVNKFGVTESDEGEYMFKIPDKQQNRKVLQGIWMIKEKRDYINEIISWQQHYS